MISFPYPRGQFERNLAADKALFDNLTKLEKSKLRKNAKRSKVMAAEDFNR